MSVRNKCFDVLCQVCMDEEYANLALRKLKLEPKEMALLTQIVYGTLQHHRYVRYLWSDYVEKLPKRKIALLLDMSVYQIVFLKTADYAVVSDAVEIAKKLYRGSYAKLVNAVLREVIRNPQKEITGSKEEQLAIRTSHPDWLIKMWIAQYGYENTCMICEHNQAIGSTYLRCNTLVNDIETFEKTMGDRIKKTVLKGAYEYCGNALLQEPLYETGGFTIMDVSSQHIAYLVDPKPNEKILDVCAAPGGKTCHMADLMHNEGTIIACDLHEHRVKLIESGAKRLHVDIIEAKVMDALVAKENFEEASFDRILCDVPCSGYGVLQGKSDIKYRMKSEDMDDIIKLQKEILESVWNLVKVDGVLVYSTCTLNKKENEKQVASFLVSHPQFVLESERTIFPFEYNSDGFYMAKLKRVV